MTLDELIAELTSLRATLPGDALIVQARDSEGNDYSPTDEVDVAIYAATSTYQGDRRDIDAEGLKEGEVEAAFLWPTN